MSNSSYSPPRGLIVVWNEDNWSDFVALIRTMYRISRGSNKRTGSLSKVSYTVPRIQNIRQIWTFVIRTLAGLKVALSMLSTCSRYESFSLRRRRSVQLHEIVHAVWYDFSSRRNVAAASSTRKQRCDNVCVMNFEAGQRRALPTCRTRRPSQINECESTNGR